VPSARVPVPGAGWLLRSLTDCAAENGVDRYFLRWRERRHARHETFGLLVLERILTPEVTSWLVDADPEIMQGLLSAVAGIDDGAVLGGLVTEADRASVERDLRENRIDPKSLPPIRTPGIDGYERKESSSLCSCRTGSPVSVPHRGIYPVRRLGAALLVGTGA
jgi:hypothetical protein